MKPSRTFVVNFVGAILILSGASPFESTVRAETEAGYTIDWSTFDSGGSTSTAGVYTASATFCHVEAIPAIAGNYTLVSGFWSGAMAAEPGQPALSLSIASARGRLIITWDGCGILEEAHTILGPWSTLAGATSPYAVAPLADKKFYRLRQCEEP